MNILIIGECGVGKTWVMKKLIDHYEASKNYALGRIKYKSNGEINILGKYTGETFEGSDKLSMSAISDIEDYAAYNARKHSIAEGDRFTNSRFIKTMNPTIIRILGDGKEGRDKRGSKQSERQIKSIRTRVNGIKPNIEVDNSQECLEAIIKIIENENIRN